MLSMSCVYRKVLRLSALDRTALRISRFEVVFPRGKSLGCLIADPGKNDSLQCPNRTEAQDTALHFQQLRRAHSVFVSVFLRPVTSQRGARVGPQR